MSRSPFRPTVTAVFAMVLFCQAATRAENPAATQPAVSAAELIEQLADVDPKVREQAGRRLWAMGRDAQPALRSAAESDNPEVSRRARAILRDFTYGLYPGAPHELFDLVDQYRKGDASRKQTAAVGLHGRGVPGLRVLLKLRQEERDANLRQMITQLVRPQEHLVAVLMLADRQTDELEQILQGAANDSPEAAQDYAALLLLQGKLDARRSALKDVPLKPESAVSRLALDRAAGDEPAALADAKGSGRNEVVRAVLEEQGKWSELARTYASQPPEAGGLPEWLGYQCAYNRLAGDREQAARAADRLAQEGRAAADEYGRFAENLFLNDRPDQGTEVLLSHHDYLAASNYLAQRLRFDEALSLPALAKQHNAPGGLELRARTIDALHFAGKIDEARRVMAEVAAENRLANDFSTWAALVEAAHELNAPKEADEYAALALEKTTRPAAVGWLLEKMRLGESQSVLQWWQFFRRQFGTDPAPRTFARIRRLADPTTAADDLKSIADEAQRYSAELPEAERVSFELTFGGALESAGLTDVAEGWFRRSAERTSPYPALVRMGDFEAKRNHWPAAAEWYAKAWELNRTRAVPLFLQGHALVEAGDAARGKALVEQAHRLPLGDAAGRLALLEMLYERKMTDDFRRELNYLLKATPPKSWERNEALRRAAEDAGGSGDELRAADLFDRAFLQNFSNNVSFNDPWANVLVPALIHKNRAIGLAKAGRLEESMAETDLTMTEAPSDADALIDIVNAMDKAGHPAEADRVFKKYTDVYRKLIERYPSSGPGHNQLAWAEVMCRRELPDATKNAERAVELEPDSTASRDTLAEVYFATNRPDAAIEQMKRCVELEPHVARHRQQLKRFQSAATGTTQPIGTGG